MLVHVDDNLGKTCTEEKQAKNGGRSDEREEIPIVSTADAVIEPDTVMVLSLDTVVANPTMMTSRWPPDVAGFAILCRHFHCGSGRLSRFDHRPIVRWWRQSERIFIFIRRRHWMKVPRENLAKLVDGSIYWEKR